MNHTFISGTRRRGRHRANRRRGDGMHSAKPIHPSLKGTENFKPATAGDSASAVLHFGESLWSGFDLRSFGDATAVARYAGSVRYCNRSTGSRRVALC